MKVWELEEGKIYVGELGIKYKVANSELLFILEEDATDKWQPSTRKFKDLIELDLIEYIPQTDWSKVEVDTKILVRDWDNSEWIPRHFAQYKSGMVHTWNNGQTSFTSRGEDNYAPYNQAKLYKEE